jgi:hypothetical protein
VRNLEFFHAPFREQILREPRIDIVIFDQQYGDHAGDPEKIRRPSRALLPSSCELLRNQL